MNRILANIILLAIMCIAFFLLLANLGNQYLWQDEAETAVVSKTILQYGVPHGYDGKNFFSQELGSDLGKNYVWRRLMWLPYYTVSGFYGIFGTSTFVSRLPFALFGIASVYLTYLFAAKWRQSKRIALIAAGLLTVCVAFLILARQCRYYSMGIFFSLLSLYFYALLLEKKKYSNILLFFSSMLLFHSQHIYIGILFPTLLLHTYIFHRDKLKSLSKVLGLVLLINSPWIIWLIGIDFSIAYGRNVMPLGMSIVRMIADIVHCVVPPMFILLAVILLIFRAAKYKKLFADRKSLERLSLLIFFVIFNMIVIVIVSPFPFFRYMSASIPILIIIFALIVDAAISTNFIFAAAAIVLLIWTQAGTSKLRDYLYEITHDFDGPIEGICKFLNEHGSADDVVAITYGDMPLKFYTKMRIVGGLTGEKLEPARNAKWVVMRKYGNSDKDKKVKLFLQRNVDYTKYRPITIDYPDTPFENREYLGEHYFRTQNHEDRVVIYERIN
ncbi:MAG: glycosyltransferase family 39 protein [Phycisphaerales bacterium]